MPNVCETGTQWRTILGNPQLIELMGIFILSQAVWIWTMGFRRYLHIVKNLSGNFSLNSTRVRALGWPLLGFFRDFSAFLRGVCGGKLSYILFRGSNTSCNLAFSFWVKGEKHVRVSAHKKFDPAFKASQCKSSHRNMHVLVDRINRTTRHLWHF